MIRFTTLFIILLSCAPLGAHDFWIEPGSGALRVGENFVGEPITGNSRVQTLERNGTVLLAYRSRQFATVELPREKFEQYLREEGLTRIRAKGDVQRERFARFAKSIVSGAPEDAGALGWRFELVPLSASRFQLLYEAKPLADTLIVAMNRAGQKLSARTDANGIVAFDLGKGTWLVKSVHMVEAPQDAGVQWESLWASLTFER